MNSNGVQVSLAELLALRSAGFRLSADARRSVHSTLLGEARSQARGNGIEVVELRPYQAGDDIRSIDWRVSARTGKPFTKLYMEERERPVFIAVDQRDNMFFGSGAVFKSVLAAKLAALFGWCALTAGNRVGGLVMSEAIQRVRSASTRKPFVQLLQTITQANQALHAQTQCSPTLEQLLHDCLSNTSTGTTVYIISDFHDIDSKTLQVLSSLGRQRNLVMLKVNDPLEISCPSVGRVGISNGLETARVSITRQQRRQHDEQQAGLVQQLSHCAAESLARLIPVLTTDDELDVWMRYANTS